MKATVLAYIRLPHFVPIVAVLTATAILAVILAGEDLTVSALLRLLLALLGGQVVVGVVNELVDVETDRLTKPDKPIPSGIVTTNGARNLGIAGLLLMLTAGATFGWQSLVLLVIGNVIGVAYSIWFKRTSLSWLPYLVALPLLPVWIAVSFTAFDASMVALFPLGILGGLAVHIAQALPDIDPDRVAGIDNLTSRLGETRAIRVCWFALLGLSIMLMVAAFATGDLSARMFAAIAIVTASILAHMLLYRYRRRVGVMAAFPIAAASVGVLAFVWLAR
ncbi:hypothetical protein BH23CHL5_BH23CHL5_25450 [soil metagenome]